jgi:dynein heavy chain
MVFGLHANAEIGYYTEAVKNIYLHLIDLQPQTASGGDATQKDRTIDTVAGEIIKKLPQIYDLDILRKKYGLTPSPMTIVLLQEVERFNDLNSRMNRSLQTLRRAIAGEVGMDATLENVYNSLYNGLIPETWLKLAPATRKPLGSWINHFLQRYQQYENWVRCE